jgi:hypothetical protein
MLQFTAMILIVLWLLGYGYGIGGPSVHLLLIPITVLLLVRLVRRPPHSFRRRKGEG